ncbi:hypothetical protein [Roseitranquillus sediminis]|uniref:hypothetical protein n=1 Tax=Roseitranquillus sediminis TaxID=2809051 RepID=UPI001D0C6189|nr:hypothetical protein [Roseitranquillus sediminis]MBM9594464.1 hypothetical protein [Roseitranquillus sediminis]
MADDDWVAQLKGIASDLTVIEINTIEASGMTGRKMPVWPHALIDVAQKFADFLTGPGVQLDLDRFREDYEAVMSVEALDGGGDGDAATLPEDPGDPDDEARPAGSLRDLAPCFNPSSKHYSFQFDNGERAFDLLRWAAHNIIEAVDLRGNAANAAPGGGAAHADPATRTILIRIKRNSDQLKSLTLRLKRLAPEFVGKTRAELQKMQDEGRQIPRAPADILTQIRKIWDIGTDRIVLQTLVQLDGDVIFRTRRDALTSANQVFSKAHERATNTALGHWQGLFDLVVGLLSGRGGRIFERTDDAGG